MASFCGNNSVVECNLAKVEVVGSNPISRSKIARSLQVVSRRLAYRAWSALCELFRRVTDHRMRDRARDGRGVSRYMIICS